MATKKQLEQMAKLEAKSKRAEAIRRTAQQALRDEKADTRLKAGLGHRAAEKAKDTEALAAGGKTRSVLRRITGL